MTFAHAESLSTNEISEIVSGIIDHHGLNDCNGIEWWMCERFEQDVRIEIAVYINQFNRT